MFSALNNFAFKSRFAVLATGLFCVLFVLPACTSQPGVKQAVKQTSTQKTKKAKTATAQTQTAQALTATRQTQAEKSGQQIENITNNDGTSQKVEISFLPIKGIPQTAKTKLSKEMQSSAGKYQVSLLSQNQPTSDYGLTGYFTALNDGSGTLLIYVWDIVDQNGKRLHRINGQERSDGTSPDPWRSIEDEQLTNVADRTMQSVRTWIASQKS